jgi:hypothetical protein
MGQNYVGQVTSQSPGREAAPGTDVMIFKIFSSKKFSKNFGVFYSKQS